MIRPRHHSASHESRPYHVNHLVSSYIVWTYSPGEQADSRDRHWSHYVFASFFYYSTCHSYGVQMDERGPAVAVSAATTLFAFTWLKRGHHTLF